MGEERAICDLCGQPMPAGEEMFRYHGYSGPCPAPPVKEGVDAPDKPGHDGVVGAAGV